MIHPTVTEPVESISSLMGSRRKRHWIGLFFTGVLPIKVERGGRPYIFTATLNAFYLKLLLYRDQSKQFTLFYARLIHLSLLILSLSITFYIFASSNQI